MTQVISQIPVGESFGDYWTTVEDFLRNQGFIRRQSTTDCPGSAYVELSTFVGDGGVIIISVHRETEVSNDIYSTISYEIDVGIIVQGRVKDDQSVVGKLREIEQIYLR